MEKFIEKIANIALYPTTKEFWILVKEAKELNNLNK
jgi:hypothetical protein